MGVEGGDGLEGHGSVYGSNARFVWSVERVFSEMK